MVKRKRGTTRMKKTAIRIRKVLFPLLLAAICSDPIDRDSIVKKCLNRLFHCLPHVELAPILSLLPSLLDFDCTEIVRRSLEIIGAVSLSSFEMNEEISADDAVVKRIISHLGNSEKETAIAACNSLLDLSTTSVGRHRLIESDAVPHILRLFIQESESCHRKISLGFDAALSKEDEYPVLLLQGAAILINSSTMKRLEITPMALSEKFLVRLKRLWGIEHRKTSKIPPAMGSINRCDFAECIFRLSLNVDLFSSLVDVESIEKAIFGSGEVTMQTFLSDFWEMSPILMRKRSTGSFRSFIRSLGLREGSTDFLTSMLENTFSCPPFASDELDILNVIKEIKNHLGFPLIYQQDIRVLKTQETEQHYFQGSHILSSSDVSKCGEAFREGYSIALRGIEFRNPEIAATADALASLFGQPSAGVNLYLTPSNSQGLARHSDDHCVFVCQLIGVKSWSVYPRKNPRLPRLYESSHSECEEEKHDFHSCHRFCLEEGDILYIPRGFPHEAKASADTGFSLHLTLAVEVEPPFEWEGFMHVALCTWEKKRREAISESSDGSLDYVSVKLLHIAIALLSKNDPDFRKACLVASAAVNSEQHSSLRNGQIAFFRELLRRIDEFERFDAVVAEGGGEPLEHLRWMKHLGPEYWPEFSKREEERGDVEACYVRFKSRFCDETEFEDVEKEYRILVQMYRDVRKRYTNGGVWRKPNPARSFRQFAISDCSMFFLSDSLRVLVLFLIEAV